MGNVCRGDMKSEQIGTDFLKDFGKYGQFFFYCLKVWTQRENRAEERLSV